MWEVTKHERNTRITQGNSDSLLSLACNTGKSPSRQTVKFGSSLSVSSLTFTIKTFTVETQSQQIFAVMLNSIHHVI